MRTLFLLAALSLTPALAHAGVDYKCDSVKYSDQVSGWLRFDSGSNGSVQMEYWNGYPPITLIDSAFATATLKSDGGTEVVSEPDHIANDTIATIQLPSGYLNEDKFVASIEMRYKSPENGRVRDMKYDLSCVRH